MPQMTIFECQKDKNMTRVKNKVINVKVVLELIPQLYIHFYFFFHSRCSLWPEGEARGSYKAPTVTVMHSRDVDTFICTIQKF
jgi:hypothetical protein